MGRTLYVLHSVIATNSVADALRRSIDEEHWTLFSLSGYRGNRPLLGEVGETTFRLQKRRYSRNDFSGTSMRDLSRSPGEQESSATSTFLVGRNTSCESGLPEQC
jgi:hypothetical protein